MKHRTIFRYGADCHGDRIGSRPYRRHCARSHAALRQRSVATCLTAVGGTSAAWVPPLRLRSPRARTSSGSGGSRCRRHVRASLGACPLRTTAPCASCRFGLIGELSGSARFRRFLCRWFGRALLFPEGGAVARRQSSGILAAWAEAQRRQQRHRDAQERAWRAAQQERERAQRAAVKPFRPAGVPASTGRSWHDRTAVRVPHGRRC